MKTKYIGLTFVLLGACFAASTSVSADTICTTVNQACVNPGGISGTCDANMICVATQTQCQRQGPNTSCTTSAGLSGTCDAASICQPRSTNGTNPPPAPPVYLTNPLGSGATLNSFVTSILEFVVRIGAIVVIFMLVYVGFLFVVARGDPTKITTARTALLWTVVGALILLGAQAIAIGIQETVQAISNGN